MDEPQVLVEGLGFPESLRWQAGRLWLCNWGAGEVLTMGADGRTDVAASLAPSTIPFSIDWLPDGRLIIVDGPRRLLLRQELDGTLSPYADLTDFGTAPFNELLVDAEGGAYVNGGPGLVVRVRPDGSVHQLADGLQFPNGMALIDEGATLLVADSHAQQLIAFDVAADGSLAGRRTWAALQHAPDGICADPDGAVWVASVPGERCELVAEGGSVLETVTVDRGCFDCVLGGVDGRDLFIGAAEWHGMDAAMNKGPGTTGQLLVVRGSQHAPADQP